MPCARAPRRRLLRPNRQQGFRNSHTCRRAGCTIQWMLMSEFLFLLAIIAGYVLLMRFVLPALGVPT